MKRLLLIGFLQMLVFSVFAQEVYDGHLNMVDKEGRKQGTWKLYDDDGNLKFYGEYLNGQPVGALKFFYPDGSAKAIVTHSDNGRVVHTRNYYNNGNPMASGKYISQKKDSTWLYYNEEDSTLSAEENYTGGMKEGLWKTYYPEGQVAEEITYRQDKKDGPWVQYFTDGKVKSKGLYVNDTIEGQFTVFYLNGMVEISGTYLNNEKDGTWVYMKETGEMEKKEEYKSGMLISKDPPDE
jgi:antitoxin component YwqK of YwqJK toxin-antitoxin module